MQALESTVQEAGQGGCWSCVLSDIFQTSENIQDQRHLQSQPWPRFLVRISFCDGLNDLARQVLYVNKGIKILMFQRAIFNFEKSSRHR